MNIVILGCQGFIGSNLCNHFINSNHTVYGVDVVEVPTNVKYKYLKVSRLSSEWEHLLRTVTFDVCINAAGSGNVSYSVTHPLIDFEANSLDVIRILDAIRIHQPNCKYVHISSAAVYGNPISLPIKETDALQPISPYGYHKMMSEIICKEYAHLFNIPVAIVRPFSIYGNGLRKQLIWDICSKLVQNKDITLFGTGQETRDFIHISDFLQLIDILIRKSKFSCEIYNAASGIETSINEVAQIFEDHYSTTKKISFNNEVKKGDPINWRADIVEINKMGFTPRAVFKNSIIEYINWFNTLQVNG